MVATRAHAVVDLTLPAEGHAVGLGVLLARRREELGQLLEDMLKQKDYASAAALQDEIKSLNQSDAMLRKKAARKQELAL